MKTNLFKPFRSRQAFTLIELIVVLTILVGLAGVLVPAVTNMVNRTNRSTSAVNISEVAGAVQRFEAIYMEYPDNLDSLVTNPVLGTGLNTLYPSLGTLFETVTLDADTLTALNNAGISSVGVHAVNDSTFDAPTAFTLLNSSIISGPTAAHQVTLGLETTGSAGKYIALGIGPRSELNGTVMVDAPVHFPRDAASNPEAVYSRFLAIFQITDGTDALTRAKFVGVVAPDGSGMSTQLDGYYTSTAND